MESNEVDLRLWKDTRRSRHHAKDKRPQKRAVTNDRCLGPGVQLRLGLCAGRGGAEGHARHESGSSADRLRRGGDSDSGRIGQGDGAADGGICHRLGRPQAAGLPDRAYGGEDPRDRRRRHRRDVRRAGRGRGDPPGHAGRSQGRPTMRPTSPGAASSSTFRSTPARPATPTPATPPSRTSPRCGAWTSGGSSSTRWRGTGSTC